MITYAIHLVLFSFGFWLIYYLLFRKETFFNANRLYLLLIPVIAAIIPLISLEFLQITSSEYVFTQKSEELLQGIYISNQGLTEVTNAENLFSLKTILWAIYGLGLGISLLLCLRRLIKLLQLKKQGKVEFYAGVELIVLPNRKDAFTFLNHIFIGAEIPETEKQTIAVHEKVHYAEKHSWDLLYFEILKILFWFNPFLYIFQKYISEVHEFIADKRTVEIQDKSVYTEVLLNTAFGTQQLSFVNSFFTNQTLKTRIMMLHQAKSTRKSKLKYLLSIPLIMLMLTYVSCSNDESAQDNNAAEQIPPPPPVPPAPESDQDEEDVYPFAMVSNPPAFKKAETFENAEEAKADFQQRIQQHVLEHFNTDLADESDGEIRINTQFAVTAKGDVAEIKVRAPQKELETEVIRVIELLPQMKPATQRGKPVKVIYQLPIIFQQDSTDESN